MVRPQSRCRWRLWQALATMKQTSWRTPRRGYPRHTFLFWTRHLTSEFKVAEWSCSRTQVSYSICPCSFHLYETAHGQDARLARPAILPRDTLQSTARRTREVSAARRGRTSHLPPPKRGEESQTWPASGRMGALKTRHSNASRLARRLLIGRRENS